MYTHVMLISILIDVQYLQNVIFSFEKDSSGQYHSFSGSHHLVKKSPSKIYLTPTLTGEGRFLPSLNAIWKNLLPPVNPPKKTCSKWLLRCTLKGKLCCADCPRTLTQCMPLTCEVRLTSNELEEATFIALWSLL